MKRLLSMLLVIVMVMSMAMTAVYADGTAETKRHPFTDVKKQWYAEAVQYVYENGLMNGKSETTFAPTEVLTRAQFAKMLWSLNGEVGTEADLDFADTKNNKWYSESLTWAVKAGIVNGYEEDGKKLFKPDQKIARDELAKMIVTFLEYLDVEITGDPDEIADPFPDKIQSWAKPYVEAVRLSGLMKGKDGGKFEPKATATRAEGAQVLMNMHKALNAASPMQKAIDDFLDSSVCIHGDYNFMFTYGSSMTVESTLYAVSQAIDPEKYYVILDGDKDSSGWQKAKDNYENCDWAAYGGGGIIKFLLVDIATGEKLPFEFQFKGVKSFSLIDYSANGLEDFHDTSWDDSTPNQAEGYCDGIGVGTQPFYAPFWCNENFGSIPTNKYSNEVLTQLDQYKDDNGTVIVPVEDLNGIVTQVGTSYGNVWYAINDLLDYEFPQYYMILTADSVHNLIVNGGEGTLKIKLTSSSSYPAMQKGEFKDINFKFVQKDVETIVDDFLSKANCIVHGQIEMIANSKSSVTEETTIAAFVDGMGISTETHKLELIGGFDELIGGYSGAGHGSSAGATLSFKLTEIATGTSGDFDAYVYLNKMLGRNDDDNTGWYYHPSHPMAIKWACPDQVSSIKSIPVCREILLGLHTHRDADGYLNISYSAEGWNLENIGNELYNMLPAFNQTHYMLIYSLSEMNEAIANGSGNVTFRVFNTVKGDSVNAEIVIPVKLSTK